MNDEFVNAMKTADSVAALCRALGIARSGFYARRARGPSATARRGVQLDVEVGAAFKRRRGRYGSARVANDLRVKGRVVSRRRVADSPRRRGLVARPKRKLITATDASHGRPSPPNLVRRKLTTPVVGRKNHYGSKSLRGTEVGAIFYSCSKVPSSSA